MQGEDVGEGGGDDEEREGRQSEAVVEDAGDGGESDEGRQELEEEEERLLEESYQLSKTRIW